MAETDIRIGTPLSPSATKVMLLGSGELGKEVVIELQRLGVEEPGGWLTTADMRVDYFVPIRNEPFVIESEVLNRSGRTHHVQTRFLDPDGTLLALAMTTLIELRSPPPDAE